MAKIEAAIVPPGQAETALERTARSEISAMAPPDYCAAINQAAERRDLQARGRNLTIAGFGVAVLFASVAGLGFLAYYGIPKGTADYAEEIRFFANEVLSENEFRFEVVALE